MFEPGGLLVIGMRLGSSTLTSLGWGPLGSGETSTVFTAGGSSAVGSDSVAVSSTLDVVGGINCIFCTLYFFVYFLRGACDIQASQIGSFSTFWR